MRRSAVPIYFLVYKTGWRSFYLVEKRGGDIHSSRSCFQATKQNLFVTSFASFCFARLWRRIGGAAFRRLTLCTKATIWCSIDPWSSSENMTIFAHQSRYPLSIWRFDLCVQGPCPVHLWPHPRKKRGPAGNAVKKIWVQHDADGKVVPSASGWLQNGSSSVQVVGRAWWLVQPFLQCCKCEVTPSSGDAQQFLWAKRFLNTGHRWCFLQVAQNSGCCAPWPNPLCDFAMFARSAKCIEVVVSVFRWET